jgi:hypothetical protein
MANYPRYKRGLSVASPFVLNGAEVTATAAELNLMSGPGDRWYVHSGTGTDGAGYGTDPDSPTATLDYAVGLATGSQGDIILLMAGHAETISSAALSPTLDKIGITVVGLGAGTMRPTFTFTHADASLIVSSASCAVYNVLLVNNVATQTIGVDVNADDFLLQDSEIRSASNEFLTTIDINGGGANGADRCTLRNVKIISEAAGATQAIEIGAVQDSLVVDGCWITGDFSVAAIHSASILTNVLLRDNMIRNINAADWAIEFSDAATGLCIGNRFYSDAAATCLDPGSMMCIDNLMVNAIDQSSIPVPTTATGVLPTGAIGAASFAAGAIDATAIAAGAIAAGTFAAGAIDAAAIANGAIDATAIADDAIDAATFAASAGEWTTDGVVVTKTAAALPQTGSAAIFTVTGLVLLKRLNGYITVGIGAVGNATKLKVNSTGAGATTDLCGTLELNNAAAANFLMITGTFANALIKTLDIPIANAQAAELIIPPGTIEVDCAGSDGGAGRVRWSVTYCPLEEGASIVAA